MATTGFRLPTTDAAVSGSWTNATNVQADDGSVAVCNIAVKNTTSVREQGGFGFSTAVLPDAATITQVNLRVEWRVQTNASVIANLGCRARVTTTDLTLHENSAEPITLTVETFDITAERAWAPGDFRDGTFKTRLQGRNGNDASDPGYEFDYVAVEVVYSVSAPVTVTPDTLALTTATFAPTVTASDNKTATPTTLALTTSTFAPTVTATANVLVTPTTASLAITTFEPTVTGGSGTTVTPSTASLTTEAFAPTVSVTENQTVTPSTASLSVSSFAPTVTATENVTVTPGAASLTLTVFAPTVTGSGYVGYVGPDKGGGASGSLRAYVDIDGQLVRVSGYEEAVRLLTELKDEEKAQEEDCKKCRVLVKKYEVDLRTKPKQKKVHLESMERQMNERADRIAVLYAKILANLEVSNDDEEVLRL